MSAPNQVVMPGAGAANPFTIPGTTRAYSCSSGSALTVNGDDALILRSNGWVGIYHFAGPTTLRPTGNVTIGRFYNDTTVGALIVYAGAGAWLNASTGASV